MRATTASISGTPMTFLRLRAGSSFWAAPASSSTSMALSGQQQVPQVAGREPHRGLQGLGGNFTWWWAS